MGWSHKSLNAETISTFGTNTCLGPQMEIRVLACYKLHQFQRLFLVYTQYVHVLNSFALKGTCVDLYMLFFQGLSCFFGSEAIRPLSRVAMTRLPAPPLHRFDCARTSRFEPHFWVQPPRSRRSPSRWATGHLVKSFID